MMTELQAAYVLHSRPLRDTSLLLDLLTQQQGKVTVVAKGVRTRNSKRKGLLQLFVPLLVNWVGRSELKTLCHVESSARPLNLSGDRMIMGLYLNELLQRLLLNFDAQTRLFEYYHVTLHELEVVSKPQQSLRYFEKNLLCELGYALPLRHDSKGNPIQPQHHYSYQPEHGFSISPAPPNKSQLAFSGAMLRALDANQLDNDAELKQAKYLMRRALAPLLNYKPLNVRQLYQEGK